jgi:TolB-like protein/DNA-binding winged helix-turn-helix (wHTH) protein/Tfp pilus assembly protein PilF
MPSSPAHIRFGAFELDLRAGELHKNGTRTRLQQQPAQLLAILLEHPGQMVGRGELRQRLWPEDTFVDFQHGLNAAVKRLREALGDSAEDPVFIETLPRRGYRFIAPVESGGSDVHTAAVTELPSVSPASRREVVSGRKLAALAIAFVLLVAAGLLGYTPWKARHAGTEIAIRSLAVLPLRDISNDAQKEYFSDGMTEALISELGKIRALRVISRQSVMRYKGTAKSIPEIAKELNVDGVVEGAVLITGRQVRISVQLIGANPEQHLWAESYRRDLGDVISLQQEVTRDIVGQIKVAALTPVEPSRLESAYPVGKEAYNAYLEGRYFFGRLNEENLATAITHYEQAVQLDPDYALAWASLAEARNLQAGTYGRQPELDIEKARQAAERALTLDRNLARAHAAMGDIKKDYDWDWTGADASYHQALALEPGDAVMLWHAADLAATLGHFEQALALSRRAVEMNPLDPSSYHRLGLHAWFNGGLDEAAAAFHKGIEINPQYPWLHLLLGAIYLAKSRPQEAWVEMQRETYPEFRVEGLAIAYHALGRKKDSDAALAELIAKGHTNMAYQIAGVYAFRGEADQAFRWLEKAYSQRDAGLPYVKGDPLLKGLQRDPRFATFLKKMHLPA